MRRRSRKYKAAENARRAQKRQLLKEKEDAEQTRLESQRLEEQRELEEEEEQKRKRGETLRKSRVETWVLRLSGGKPEWAVDADLIRNRAESLVRLEELGSDYPDELREQLDKEQAEKTKQFEEKIQHYKQLAEESGTPFPPSAPSTGGRGEGEQFVLEPLVCKKCRMKFDNRGRCSCRWFDI